MQAFRDLVGTMVGLTPQAITETMYYRSSGLLLES
jgi:hypothetical protein